MAAYNKFDCFTDDLCKKKHDFSADTFKVLLTDTAPVRTNKVKSDITEIAAATGGYTAGGLATTVTLANAAGTETVKASNITVSLTATMGPFRYGVVYNATSLALIGWFDYATETTGNNGDTIGITFDQTNGLFNLV